jgi:hypothetical protein
VEAVDAGYAGCGFCARDGVGVGDGDSPRGLLLAGSAS